jgi:hypothetical protein
MEYLKLRIWHPMSQYKYCTKNQELHCDTQRIRNFSFLSNILCSKPVCLLSAGMELHIPVHIQHRWLCASRVVQNLVWNRRY